MCKNYNKNFLFCLMLLASFYAFAQNGPNCPSLCFGPGGSITSGSLTISSNTYYSSITIKSGATLTVESGATLYVGAFGTAAGTQVVDFQNGSTVLIKSGGSLVVNGKLNNSNNSTGVTFDGSVTVTGNVTAGNNSIIDGAGTLQTTGSITNNGFIFNSTGGCTSSCFFSSNCPTNSLMFVSATSGCKTSNVASVTMSASAAALPVGTYTVTYSLGYDGNTTPYTAPMTVTTAGTGTFTANLSNVNATSSTTIRVNNLATSAGCSVSITANNVSNSSYMYPAASATTISNIYANCTSYNIQWNNMTMDKYFLDVATDSGFTNFLPGYQNKDMGNVFSHEFVGLVNGTTYYCRVRSNNYCGTSANSNVYTFTKLGYNYIPSISGGATSVCTSATTPAFINSDPGGTWSIVNETGSASITSVGVVTGISSGTVKVVYTKNFNGCISSVTKSLTVNGITPTPVVSLTQPTCTISTGTITVNTPASASGITYTVVGTSPVVAAITNSTGVFSGLTAGTYNVTANNTSSCGVSAVTSATLSFVINTWNGTSWSNGTPNNTQSIIFDEDYNSSSDLTGTVLNACSCTVNAGRTVDFYAGHTLNLINGLQVVSGGEIFFKDTSSLVQETNVQNNVGTIKYERKVSNTIRESDYTYWSSPVAGFTLGSVYSPNPNGMFYSYASTAVPEDWKEESSSTVMAPGVGYIINGKIPVSFPAPPTIDFFEGVPNSGPITVPVVFTNPLGLPLSDPNYGVSYLLGNPYPSAIDASSFLSANSSYLGGTLYFWTHNTEIGIGVTNPGTGAFAYSGDDYASFNGTGGVAASGGAIPTGYIAAGQGFFATSIASGNVIFNNDMRVSANNTQFFKIKKPNSKAVSTIEKNRVWLNLTNTQGVFKQTLVGYVTNATNEFDTNFDGITFDGNEFVDFYSINQNNNLVIQGRSLPFDENDEVPLGFRTTINGDFTIDVDQVDGLLTNQPVFIEDKWTNTTFDLKNGKYTFNTAAGTFNDRFVLKFTSKTLGIDVKDKEDGILAFYSNDYKTLIIKNYMSDTTVNSVTLFNLQGQKIENWDVSNKDQNNIQIPIKNRSSGIYLVKVKTSKGESTKKIIVN